MQPSREVNSQSYKKKLTVHNGQEILKTGNITYLYKKLYLGLNTGGYALFFINMSFSPLNKGERYNVLSGCVPTDLI